MLGGHMPPVPRPKSDPYVYAVGLLSSNSQSWWQCWYWCSLGWQRRNQRAVRKSEPHRSRLPRWCVGEPVKESTHRGFSWVVLAASHQLKRRRLTVLERGWEAPSSATTVTVICSLSSLFKSVPRRWSIDRYIVDQWLTVNLATLKTTRVFACY